MANVLVEPVVEERVRSADGLEIFVRSWQPEEKPRAVVAIVHGFNSHSGQYTWAAEQFVAGGFAVYALDLRGRGRSSGERFYVERIEEYLGDVATLMALVREREPRLRVFLLGHSAGGVISSVYTLEHQAELAGLVCESFAFRVPAPPFALTAIKGVSRVAPRLGVLRLKNKDFSRDPARVEALDADPLTKDEVQPAITVAAMVRGTEDWRGVPADHPAGADPARHAGQGDLAERQPAVPRKGRLHRQDAEALRGPLPRPPRRRGQGAGDGGRAALDDPTPLELLTAIGALDALLDAHAAVLGSDFAAYRNHAYRVANLCVAQSAAAPQPIEKVAIAAALHDLGIWTDRTFDYLRPSVELARAHLERVGRSEWSAEISTVILEHHQLSPHRGNPGWLVEPFRRVDWADVTRGLVTFGLPRRFVREVFSVWPSAGFHKRLVQLGLTRLRTHPASPLPMLRL